MTPEQIIASAKQRSIAKGLALTLVKDGETTHQYFQDRQRYEDFVNRALTLGYEVQGVRHG